MRQLSFHVRKNWLDHRSESRHRRNPRLRLVLRQMPQVQPTTLEQTHSPRNRQTTTITIVLHRLNSYARSTLNSHDRSFQRCVWVCWCAHTHFRQRRNRRSEFERPSLHKQPEITPESIMCKHIRRVGMIC